MDVTPVEIRYYQTISERSPFREWLDAQEMTLQQIVAVRLARVRRGPFGDEESVGGGVFELKIDIGPGYRIYFGKDGKVVVILLQAGEKKRQSSDIRAAQAIWEDYSRRTRR